MAHRLQHLESVSCSCGHGYCVFCIKAYLTRQQLRDSFPQSEEEWLIQLQPGDVRDSIEEKPGTTDIELVSDTVGLQKSRPVSRKSSQGFRNSQPEEVKVEPILNDFSTREEFLQYAHVITLDPDTAFKNLVLSEGNKRVTNIGRSQGYLDYPDRFNFFWQVLSLDSLAGRSYLELDWTGPWIYVAMAYQCMQRYGNGKECGFGGNDKSWALHCRKGGYNFWHNAQSTQVTGPAETRIGVYLDHEAGVLTFYSVQDQTMTALHRVQTEFKQRLHFGLWVAVDASAVFCKLK